MRNVIVKMKANQLTAGVVVASGETVVRVTKTQNNKAIVVLQHPTKMVVGDATVDGTMVPKRRIACWGWYSTIHCKTL